MNNQMSSTTKEVSREFAVEYDLTRFPKFLESFQQSEFWKSMEATVEDSPWHREANVAVHTLMGLEQAKRWFPIDGSLESQRHILLTQLAILFHDTGKPPMEVVKENEERGVYRSYANHEQRSARIFESYVMDHWVEWFQHWITPDDVFAVSWIIEHHLPYGLKNENKIAALVDSLLGLPMPRDIDIFFNSLRGDAYGRTSDNWETNVQNMEAWVADMIERIKLRVPTYNQQVMDSYKYKKEAVFLIAPPGAGKSSARILFEDYKVFNLDELRVQFYRDAHPDLPPADVKADYNAAFWYTQENETQFKIYTNAVAGKMFKNETKILLDNTNVSIKGRRQYLEMARQNGFFTSAVYIPASLKLLKERNESRPDKKLPVNALEQLFYAVALPSRGGEFHSVVLSTSNYPK